MSKLGQFQDQEDNGIPLWAWRTDRDWNTREEQIYSSSMYAEGVDEFTPTKND
jgi:hypothetical protein